MKDTKPVFDRSRAGEQALSQRHDQPGDEWGCYAEEKTESKPNPYHGREDNGYRPEGQCPSLFTPAEDAGKVYTQAEIAALYPDGYVSGAASLHHVEGSHYRFPEARPKRICG